MKYFLVRLNLILLLLIFSHTSYAAITSSLEINRVSISNDTQLQVMVLGIDQNDGSVYFKVEKNHLTQVNNNYSFLADGSIGMYKDNTLVRTVTYQKGAYALYFSYKMNLLTCERNNIEFRKIGDDTIKTPTVTITNNPASCAQPTNNPNTNDFLPTELKLDAIKQVWKGFGWTDAVSALDYYMKKSDTQPIMAASTILNSTEFSDALKSTLRSKVRDYDTWFKNNWSNVTNRWLGAPTIHGSGSFAGKTNLSMAMGRFKFEINTYYLYAQTYNNTCIHYYFAHANTQAYDNYQFDYTDSVGFFGVPVFDQGDMQWMEVYYRPFLYKSEWAIFYPNSAEYLTSACL
jgi:hypothetical protein